MAVPTYSTDLATVTADTTKGTIYRQDSTTALTTTGCLGTLTWGEPTGSTQGGIPAVDTDYFILGVATADKAFNATGVGGLGVGTTNAASLPTDGAFFFWSMFTCPNAVSAQSSGGIQVLIGSTLANYYRYYVAGDDTHPYGGWKCYPVNPAVAASATNGTPTSTRQYFGIAYNVDNAVSKGNPAACGGIRFGRGYLLCVNGQAGNYATFTGASTFNDYNDATNGWNRLGLVQLDGGTFKIQGLFQMGSAATAVDFRDSDKNIVILNTQFVTSGFNSFSVYNVSSRVDWTNISIQALGTVSRGNFIAVDNATINLTNCVFTGMGTFTFQSNSTVTACTFRSCNLITRGNASFTNCVIETTNDSVKALLLRDPSKSLTGCTFVSSGTKHAIEITETGTYTFTDNTFTGYATSNGSTGNEVIYNNSGGLVTISHSGTTGSITYRNQGTSTTSIVGASYSITVTVKDESNSPINSANVYIFETNTSNVVVNTTTNSSGIVSSSYSGSESSGTLRVRKYGYKPFEGSVNLSSNIDQGIVLIADSTQDASPQDLSSYYTINTSAKTVTSVGNGTYSVKEYFKWLANTFAASGYMDDKFPVLSDTDTVFHFINGWTFGSPTTDYKYLFGGSITNTDESKIWSNIYSLGSIMSNTTFDVYQNDSQITPWWSSGHIDILVQVKDTTEIDNSFVTVLARKYSTLYDFYTVEAPGGRNPVPLATFNDANNQTAEGTVGASPYTNITFSFGAKSKDLGNGNGFRPYEVEINCAGLTIKQVYEYLKYVTRTGSSTTLNGVNGEFYTGVGDVRFNYDTEGGGGTAFSEGELITGTGGDSPKGYLVSLIDNGTTGTMVIRNVHGTFTDNQTITGGTSGRTALVNGTITYIDKIKQAPFGTFAGGKFFGAFGVYIYNVAIADSRNYSLIDSTNTIQDPPITIPITVNGIVSGDRVSVFRALDQNGTIDKTYIASHATSNSASSTTWTAVSIPADTPLGPGIIRLRKTATQTEERLEYTTRTATAFTLSTPHSGGYGTGDTAYVPYLDGDATGTSMSTSVTYEADRYITTRVRKKGIQPFTVNNISLNSSGYSATATRIEDSIVV